MKEEDAAASEDSKPDKKVLIPRFTFSSETPKRRLADLMQAWFQETCGKCLQILAFTSQSNHDLNRESAWIQD